MRRLLLITDAFCPAFAPRMAYLTRFLPAHGWQSEVVAQTEPIGNKEFRLDLPQVSVHPVKPYRPTAHRSYNVLAAYACGFWRYGWLWSVEDERFYRTARAVLAQKKCDAILCSVSAYTPLPAAVRLARQARLPLLLDFRDVYEQDSTFFRSKGLAGLLHRWQIRSRNRMLQQAAAVCTVSPWHRTLLAKFNPYTHCIYNGYDANSFSFFPVVPHPCFTLVYTGALATHDRNPELLFQGIRKLIEKHVMQEDKVRMFFYTDDNGRVFLTELVAQYALQKQVQVHAWVEPKQIPVLLAGADVLLLLHKAQTAHGVLTTKLFEYMAARREILCIAARKGDIREVLNEAQAGICITKLDELTAFLTDRYQRWEQTGALQAVSREAVVQRHSRQYQAGQFAVLLDSFVSIR